MLRAGKKARWEPNSLRSRFRFLSQKPEPPNTEWQCHARGVPQSPHPAPVVMSRPDCGRVDLRKQALAPGCLVGGEVPAATFVKRVDDALASLPSACRP